jgi:hypothetical protein
MIDYKSSILNMTSNNKYFIQDWDTINKYFIQDCSFKLLLFHVRLFIQIIIIISCKIDQSNYYYFM